MTSSKHLTLVVDPDADQAQNQNQNQAQKQTQNQEQTQNQAQTQPAPRPVAFDEREYRDAVGAFASGVTVITTHGADGPVGFTCQSFYSVSIDPPLVSFSIARTSKSLESVRAHRKVVVNFLGATQQHLSGQFARSGTDKWQGVEWHPAELNGAPTLNGVIGWVAGEIEQEIEAGDHLIFLVRVAGLSTDPEHAPLVFYRGKYHDIEYQI